MQQNIYIGYYLNPKQPHNNPVYLKSSINKDYEECMIKTTWELAKQNIISDMDAVHMDINLANKLGLHILELPYPVIEKINQALK